MDTVNTPAATFDEDPQAIPQAGIAGPKEPPILLGILQVPSDVAIFSLAFVEMEPPGKAKGQVLGVRFGISEAGEESEKSAFAIVSNVPSVFVLHGCPLSQRFGTVATLTRTGGMTGGMG